MTKIYNQNKNPKVVAIKETYRFWGSEYSPNDISSIIEVTNRYRQKLKQKIHNHTDLLEARIAYNIYLLVIKRTHNSRDTYLYQDHLKARYYRAILFTFYHCRSEEKSDFDMFNELDDLGNNGMSVEKVLIAKAMTHFLWASSETENVSHIKKTVEYLKKLEDSSKRKNELMESVIYFQRNTSKIPGHIAFTSIINAAGLLDEL